MSVQPHEMNQKEGFVSGLSEGQDNPLYQFLQTLLDAGAQMANLSLKFVQLTLGLSIFCLLGGLFYLISLLHCHWAVALIYGMITTIPVGLLAFYGWILRNLKDAPKQLVEFKELIIRFYHEHPDEAREVASQKLVSIGKWKTYRLIGRVIKDLASGTDQALTLTGNLKTLSIMANPFFWLTLALSLFISVTFSGVLLIAFSIHALIT